MVVKIGKAGMRIRTSLGIDGTASTHRNRQTILISVISHSTQPGSDSEVSGLARHVRLTLRSRHRQPAPACPFGAKALNRCAIARGGGRGAHRYGSTRGEMVSSVWVILS